MILRAIRFRLSGFPRVQSARPASSISGPSRLPTPLARTVPSGAQQQDDGRVEAQHGRTSRSSTPPHRSPSPLTSGVRSMHTSAQPIESPPRTHGRRRRRALLLAAREQSTSPPTLTGYHSSHIVPLSHRSSPIFTTSVQAQAHVAHTPSHLPLPIPLGTEMYDLHSLLHPSSIYGSEIPWTVFESTSRPIWIDQSTMDSDLDESISEALTNTERESSVLNDHLAVVDLLDPDHHLAPEKMHEDVAEYTSFEGMMRDREVRNRLESQAEWEDVLVKLGDKSREQAQDLSTLDKGEKLEVKDAIDDLFTTLQRIDATPRDQRREARQVDVLDHDGQYVEITNDDGGRDVVFLRTGQDGERRYRLLAEDGEVEEYQMTSVVRKRRKKIKKHKYKKRRKDQRALRKRLGK